MVATAVTHRAVTARVAIGVRPGAPARDRGKARDKGRDRAAAGVAAGAADRPGRSATRRATPPTT
ncbi:hypothetical protein GCM10017559_37750 [Streptosporangium longisporum]|uniref:Uncharacterized protein n=1 Tax=Streptosporangium longisporum TaxID=46187 RepID=A0ABN3Y072_9ACTN